MKNTRGFIVPLILLTLSGLLLYCTLVWCHAFYAYASARQQYRVYQREYALKGLLSQAVDECMLRVRTSGNFTQPYAYEAPEWNIPNKTEGRARVVIEPLEPNSYKITATIGFLNKTSTLHF